MNIEYTWIDDEGEEITHSFPAVNEVCDRCEGFGTHLNPSIGNHAYSREEFEESFDEEEQEEYFRHGGRYDVQCEVCNGNKVILVVDELHLFNEDIELYKQYKESQEQLARWDAEDLATRRGESGYYE